jgi:hypothetical protein
MNETITFTRTNNDTNGNPRYVVHFLKLLTREEVDSSDDVLSKYASACHRARSIGGRKYSNRSYGGGIVFQSYCLRELADAISRVTGRNFTVAE